MARLFLVVFIFCACSVQQKLPVETINATGFPSPASAISFSTGIAAYNNKKIDYKDDASKFKIHFGEPVVVGVASKPEKWGFFQFPNIGRRVNGAVQAKWNMTRDAIEAYGEETHGAAISFDNGKTFKPVDSAQATGSVELPNGDKLEVYTPTALKEKELNLPKPIGIGIENYRKSNFTFYKLHDLPESRNGVYFKRLKKGEKEWKIEKAKLIDNDAARYSLAGLIPVLFWGDIRVAKDGSLIAGIYPGFYIGSDGKVDPRMGAFFYRSVDNGYTWNVQGRVLYYGDEKGDPAATKRMGYTEPAFEILSDGTFLCVLRTTDGAGNGPMYASYSKDMGKTWRQPQIITANGVYPRLLQLQNGVTVMSSGRPGVQLRFSTDNNGIKWSKPFEMLPYEYDGLKKEQSGATAQVSCGYTGLLPIGKNKLLLIYSDFNYKTAEGNIRKAIKVREIEVQKSK